MNNFLLGIASFFVLVLAALFAVPPLIDWNEFRGTFEEEASRILDREVRVRGQVNVRILPVPYVSFEKVRIGDAPGIPGSFARAEQFKMWLAVPPLLRGIFEARQIELDRPVIRLRTEPEGGGNWSRLKVASGSLPYVPNQVALSSLRILDGTLLLESHRGHEILNLSGITGEMTATGLRGPFKFIGTLAHKKTPHEVRISTASMEENGSVRFSGTLRSPERRLQHTVNGTFFDLLGQFRATGQLVSQRRPPRTTSDTGATKSRTGYELTAQMKFDAEALRLDDIAISFRDRQRQQTLNGSAVASWTEGVVTETNLSAAWLDLDAIAGTGPEDGPIEVFKQLVLQGASPLGAGVASVRISINQANLAGTSISNVKGRLIRRDGVTKLEGLRASLPGNSALALDGFIEGDDGALKYDGSILLRSASLAELARWMRADLKQELETSVTAPFELRGSLRLRPEGVELTDAKAKLAQAEVDGSLNYNWAGRPALVADLESGSLRLAGLGDGLLQPGNLIRLLGLSQTSSQEGAAQAPWLQGTDVAIRLKAEDVSDGSQQWKDVEFDFGRTKDGLNLKKFDLTWDPGLRFELNGKLSRPGKPPAGGISGVIVATGDAAAARLVELGGMIAGARLSAEFLRGRTPLRLAVDASLGETSSVLELDGSVGPDRIRLDARTDGPVTRWFDQFAHVQARISGDDAVRTARLILGIDKDGTAGASAGRGVPAKVILTAAGTPSKRMNSFARLAGGKQLGLDFAGELNLAKVDDDLRHRWSGHADIWQASLPTLARILAPAVRNRVPDAAVAGRVALSSNAEGLSVKPNRLAVGSATLTADVNWNRGSAKLTGRAQLSDISMQSLGDFILTASGATATAPDASEEDPAPLWSDRTFEFSHLSGVQTDLDVKLDRLHFAGGTMRKAAFKLVGSADGVSINEFSANYDGAKWNGGIDLKDRQAGVELTARLKGSGIKLANWAKKLAASGRLGGSAVVDLNLKGKGLSPRSLATVVTGSGTAQLRDVVLPGLNAETVTTAARSVVDGDMEVDELQERLASLARHDSIQLGGPLLKVRIARGTLELPQIKFQLDRGAMRNQTFFDLPRWRVDSRWTITPAPQPKPDAPEQTVPLPPISLVYGGEIAEFSQLEPQINVGDLERELIVRKMEANVARLERLRRDDEERAAAERERERLREEEQRRSIEEELRRRRQEQQGLGEPPAPRTLIAPPAPARPPG